MVNVHVDIIRRWLAKEICEAIMARIRRIVYVWRANLEVRN